MKEPASGAVSPASPSPLVSGSPGGQTADFARPPPQIPDHELLLVIGHGAYGQVWLARNVVGTLRAVKVLYAKDFGDPQPFDREFNGIQKFEPISRSHPGLMNILQIGRHETEGCFYYVMELADAVPPQASDQSSVSSKQSESLITDHCSLITVYQPRTLRSDLKLHGRLPFDECLQIGLALTSALQHLHSHGLVHRDVKPSNIIFVNGQPKLADIGLVAGVDEARSFVGTEGFIPPEGPGKPQADLYSLGIVLYIMSTGKRHDAFPEPLTDLASDPDHQRWLELNAVIHKAAHANPRERYQTAEEMHADLVRLRAGKSLRRRRTLRRMAALMKRAWPVLAAVALLLLGVPWLMRQQSRNPPATAPEKASVFVLPFRYEGTNSVASGPRKRITDALIDSLASIHGVRRSPRKSGWVYQDEDLLRRSLAQTNDMRHILTGRLGGSGNTLTLTLRLYARGVNPPVWTETFSGTANQVVALEQSALAKMAEILGLKITEHERQKIGLLLTNNLEALKWLLQAEAAYQTKAGTQLGYQEVQTLAQKALELDPNYVDAEAWMVYQLRNLSQDRAANEVWPAVYRGMSSILERDDTHPLALDQLAAYALVYKRDWAGSYDLFTRELRSRSLGGRPFIQAFFYRIYGWFDEARNLQEKAEYPEMTGVDARFHSAASRWAERRYGEGAQVARRTLELYPGHAEGYFWLAHSLVGQGEFEMGLQAIEKAQEVWKKQEMTALKGYIYARTGQTNEAHAVLRELMVLQRTGPYLEPVPRVAFLQTS